jgi:uncharacterized protein YegL
MPAPRVTSNSPWHLIFVLDDSGSMAGVAANKLNEALDAMIEEMRLMSQGTKPYFKLSILVFGSNVNLVAEAQTEQAIDKTRVSNFSGSSGSTNMAAALAEAAAVLKRNPGKATDFDPYIFLLTDGQPDDESQALRSAQAIRDMEVAAGKPRLIAIGLGDSINMSFLQQVATNAELAKHLQKADDLVKFFPAIGTVVSSAGGAQAVDQAIVDI